MDNGRRLAVERRAGTGPGPACALAPAPRSVAPGHDAVARVVPVGRSAGSPLFAVPGLVLLAALSIYEGYHWLQIIPSGSLHQSGLLFAVVAVPATYGLTRDLTAGLVGFLRHLALVTSTAVPLLAGVVVVGHGAGWARVLGVASLLLAASVIALAAVTERDRRGAALR